MHLRGDARVIHFRNSGEEVIHAGHLLTEESSDVVVSSDGRAEKIDACDMAEDCLRGFLLEDRERLMPEEDALFVGCDVMPP